MYLYRHKGLLSRNLQTLANTSVESVTSVKKTPVLFQQWILNYFQKTDNYLSYKSILPLNKIKGPASLEAVKIKDIQKIRSNIHLFDYNISLDDVMHNRISCYKKWDSELFLRIKQNPQLVEILKMMDFWTNFLPNKCSNLQSYGFAVEFINDIVKYEEISKENLIQCMHYVSVLKNRTVPKNIMNTVLNKMHKQPKLVKQFTLEEMCIFCNSLFATSTKINSKVILEHIVTVLNENLEQILLSEYQHMISCLVKPLRLSKYYDYEMLDNTARKVLALKINNSKCVVHLLALYSDALYSNLTQIEGFGYNFLSCFKIESKLFEVRIKDIDRFLWAFSNLGCESCKNEITDIIVPYLVDKIIYVKEWPAYYVNSLLWLQMLQCSSEELVKSVLTTQTLQRILKSGHLRNPARFSLLLSCLNIENKEYLSEDMFNLQQNTLEPEMGMHLAMRKHLANVHRVVMCLQKTLGIKSVKVSYQIPCLYIAGITIQTNKTVNEIEVLEESVCLHNSEIPHGLMKLKLRLMKRMGSKVILVDKNTRELETEGLFTHIEDKIKNKCYM